MQWNRIMGYPRTPSLLRLMACAIVALLILVSRSSLLAKEYSIQSWRSGHGLEARGFACCMISREGTVWIGAVGDLLRFDGLRFERVPFGLAKRFSGNRITALWEDAEQRIWCGYETGDVVVYDEKKGSAQKVHLRWERQPVVAIHGDSLGDVWLILGNHRLVRVQDGKSMAWAPGAESAGGVMGFVQTRSGSLLAEYSCQVSEWRRGTDGGTWVPFPRATGYTPGVAAGGKGGVWLVDQRQQVSLVEANGAIREVRQIPAGAIAQILEAKAGNLLVATVGEGIFSIGSDGRATRYGLKDGLAADWITQMVEDPNGDVVAVSPDSVSILRVSEAQTIPDPVNLGGARLACVAGGSDGDIWVGTEGAGLFRLHEGVYQHFGSNEGLTKAFVWSVLDEGAKGVWVGTWGGGLFHGVNGRFALDPEWEHSNRWVVTAILRAADGALWVGTNRGIGRKKGGRWTWYDEAAGTPLAIVRCLALGPGNKIWFGTNGQGAGYIDGATVRLLDPQGRTGSLFASALSDDGTGGVWIGSSGEGLFHWRSGAWTQITTEEGLPSNDIFQIDSDRSGRLWFTSSAGVYSIRRSDLDAMVERKSVRVYPVTINGDDGLPSNQCAGGTLNAAYMDQSGRYYVPTSSGLALIDTRRVHGEETVLHPSITRVSIDGRPCSVGGMSLIAYPQTQSIRIGFTAPTLVHPELVEFAYRLDDRTGSTWVNLGHSRSILLQRLSPGRHWLEIGAQNPGSMTMGRAARLEITQKPLVSETLWFHGLVAAAAIASLTLLVWIMIRGRYLRAHRRLELEAALEKERRRIARDIHDDLGTHLAQVMVLSQGDDLEGDPEARRLRFTRIHTKATEITKAFDELVWAINPSHDSIEGFASYASRLAQDTLSSAGKRCRLKIPQALSSTPLSSGTRHHLIMCMKEAITNALKHADCNVIEVRLDIEPQGLRIVVSDDGSGFDVDGSAREHADDVNHSGLSNLRARMRELNGTLTLTSTPGQGTQVVFECPL